MAGGRRRTDPAVDLPVDLPVDEVPTGVVRPTDHDPADPGDHHTTPGALRSRADRRRDALLGDETDRRRPLTGRQGRPAVPARPAEAEPPAARTLPPANGATRAGPAANGATRAAPAPPNRLRRTAGGATRQAPAPQAPAPQRAAPPPVPPREPAAPPTAARLPAPPPAAAPPAAAAPVAAPPPARAAAPLTTVAPFQAVPTPHGDAAPPAAPPLDPWDQPVARSTARPAASSPPPATRAIPDRDVVRGRAAAPATEAIPDREVVRGRAAAPATEAIPDRDVLRGRAAAPATEAIPDRGTGRDGRPRDRAPEPPTGPDTGPSTGATGVVGNRAAMRAERQAREVERHAMEAERRKAARRAGVSRAALRAADGHDAPPRRRRTGLVLLAAVVVALVVLGVYSYTSTAAREAPTTTAPTPTSAPATVPPATGALPSLSVEPLPPVADVPSTEVRVPVTVLNATGVSGLAADVAAQLDARGWTSAGVGSYDGGDIAATTVFVTDGDERQRQSAVQLLDAFPAIALGPTPRFFEVPGAADPGIVVVVAGEWPS